MKIVKHSKLVRYRRDGSAAPAADAEMPARKLASVPAIVASAFGKLNVERRVRLLGRLIGSVGPLALAVVGGGVFAKYLRNAGWPEVPVSFEDAARATSSQVHDLVRYVEQSNPHLVEGLLAALLQDGMTMTALDASVAGHHDQAPLESPRLEAGIVPSRNETEPRNLLRGGWPVRNASIVNSCLEQ